MAAKVEASSAYHGIGLVKLMGRQSGFIAMQASMASGVVDIVSCAVDRAGWGEVLLRCGVLQNFSLWVVS